MSVDSGTVLDTAVMATSVTDTAAAAVDSVATAVSSTVSAVADTVATAVAATADSPMTIKMMLAQHESDIVILFAILVYSVIAFKVISVIIGAIKAGKKKDEPAVTAPAVHTDSGAQAGSIKLIDVDEKTAALAMAIVAHESEIPVDQLIFKSIRAIDSSK